MKNFQLRFIDFLFLILFFLLGGFLVWQNFGGNKTLNLAELNAERINIKGADGKLYLVLSNPEKQVLATMDGKILDPNQKRDFAGMVFFNRLGDEVGGLVYDANASKSIQGLTFDQFKNDELMILGKKEEKINEKWQRSYGLTIQERPDSPNIVESLAKVNEINQIKDPKERQQALTKFTSDSKMATPERLFIGRSLDGTVGLVINDRKNNPRIILSVDKNDEPKLEFLDAQGKSVPLASVIKQ